MEAIRKVKSEVVREEFAPVQLAEFCDRVSAIVGNVASAGMMTYEIWGESVIAYDFGGSAGDVKMTMFPDGKTEIPGDREFVIGRLGGHRHKVELEFGVADFVTAGSLCTRLIETLEFELISVRQAALRDAASLRQLS